MGLWGPMCPWVSTYVNKSIMQTRHALVAAAAVAAVAAGRFRTGFTMLSAGECRDAKV